MMVNQSEHQKYHGSHGPQSGGHGCQITVVHKGLVEALAQQINALKAEIMASMQTQLSEIEAELQQQYRLSWESVTRGYGTYSTKQPGKQPIDPFLNENNAIDDDRHALLHR
jgi:nucleoid DNA-binding protein